MTDKEVIAHDLAFAYLMLHDKNSYKSEGEFVGQYENTKRRIIEALPDIYDEKE